MSNEGTLTKPPVTRIQCLPRPRGNAKPSVRPMLGILDIFVISYRERVWFSIYAAHHYSMSWSARPDPPTQAGQDLHGTGHPLMHPACASRVIQEPNNAWAHCTSWAGAHGTVPSSSYHCLDLYHTHLDSSISVHRIRIDIMRHFEAAHLQIIGNTTQKIPSSYIVMCHPRCIKLRPVNVFHSQVSEATAIQVNM